MSARNFRLQIQLQISASSTPTITMPRFLCYCPDLPDALERRLAVRPVHLEAAKKDLASGLQTDGSPFLPIPGSAAASRSVPEGALNLTGSFMIYDMATIDDVWKRLHVDVYWENNVWDKEQLVIWPLLT